MLIGGKKPQKAAQAAPASGDIFDVTTDQFENAVLKASMETPVIVDFWAPWCGPCKQLGPVLEAAVAAAGGKVKMAKINIDENPELAQALRVQSIPTVFAFFQGQPVTAFTGAKPASEIKMLIDQLAKMGQTGKGPALNISEILAAAAKALGENDIVTAQGLYMQVMGEDETNAAAYAGLLRTFINSGDLEQASYMADDAPETIAKDPVFLAAKTALDLARNAPQGTDLTQMEKAVQNDPADHQKRLDYALALFAAGQKAQAIDQIIEIIRRDKASAVKWQEDKARSELFRLFDAMGPADPETLSGRRKLSSLLFS